MNINDIFKTAPAQHIYRDYMTRIERCLRGVSSDIANELLMEYQSHIFEATRNSREEEEFTRLTAVIQQLGIPEEFLKPVIAGKTLEKATKTFNPVDVFRALVLNIRNGVIFTVFGLLYLFLFSFLFLVVAKIFFPNHTGLFYDENGFRSFGFFVHSEGTTEMLGLWLIPLSLLTASVLYLLITLLLRLTKKK